MNKKLKILKWIFFSLMIIVNAFIIYQSCLPDVSSKSWSDAVVDVIKAITNGNIDSSTPITPTLSWGKFIRKMIGHFSLFGLDGVVTFLYFYYLDIDTKHKYKYLLFFLSIALGILLAVITESLQLIIPGRYGDIIDTLIDIGGYIFGFVIALLVTLLVGRKRRKMVE